MPLAPSQIVLGLCRVRPALRNWLGRDYRGYPFRLFGYATAGQIPETRREAAQGPAELPRECTRSRRGTRRDKKDSATQTWMTVHATASLALRDRSNGTSALCQQELLSVPTHLDC